MKIIVKCFAILCWAGISLAAFSFSQTASVTVPYPTGFRSWVHVKTGIVGKDSPRFKNYVGIHHIYANPKAVEGYEKGTFPDGSVIVVDVLEAPEINSITSEGSRKFIDVMRKDSKKFAKTAGWGFEKFNGDSTTERLLNEGSAANCSACHASQKDHVFSDLRK
ncbi:MAG TPA: cytochrome P460 family protein [Pyrinomonadaceae bacterium]|nr:cytochrome P460 family protein [Pyrinomonadaceae bacterium]